MASSCRWLLVAPALAAFIFACAHRKSESPERTVVQIPAPAVKTVAADVPVGLPVGPIRVGILHSLSGAMARDEVPLRHVVQMALDEINSAGGIFGKTIQVNAVDPQSSWPMYAELVLQLGKEDTHVLFGGLSPASRKTTSYALQGLKEQRGKDVLMFFPGQYEGEKPSPHLLYTGAVPNQSVLVVANYLFSRDGGAPKTWVLIGTDMVTARMQERALRAHLTARGVAGDDIVPLFTPFGHSDYAELVGRIEAELTEGSVAVLCALDVDSAVPFHAALRAKGIGADRVPVYSFRVDERTLDPYNRSVFAGQYLARAYFSTLDNSENRFFKERWTRYTRAAALPDDQAIVPNDEMESSYVGVRLWKQAVEKARSLERRRVLDALSGETFDAPSGFRVQVHENHHLSKPYFIGRVEADGRVTVVYRTATPTPPEPTFGDVTTW